MAEIERSVLGRKLDGYIHCRNSLKELALHKKSESNSVRSMPLVLLLPGRWIPYTMDCQVVKPSARSMCRTLSTGRIVVENFLILHAANEGKLSEPSLGRTQNFFKCSYFYLNLSQNLTAMLTPQKNTELSVVVPTYNRSQLLDYTLFSLTEQSLPKDLFEVIVVDDGSTDNTKEIVEKYSDIIHIRYYFQEDKGYRPGSARNIGIANADGKICLLIDSGILLGRDCLKAHHEFHTKNGPNVAVLGYVFGLYPSHEFEHIVSETVEPYKPSEAIGIIKDNEIFTDVREKYYAKYGDDVSQLPAPWVFFLSCNVSVSKQDLLHVQMFDEAYDGRWGCEDNDLGYRLHQEHVKITLCRAAESFHYPHTGDMGSKVEQGYLNCIYFNSKFNTPETNLFLKHYKEIAISESIDINEELLLTKLK